MVDICALLISFEVLQFAQVAASKQPLRVQREELAAAALRLGVEQVNGCQGKWAFFGAFFLAVLVFLIRLGRIKWTRLRRTLILNFILLFLFDDEITQCS